MDGERRGGGEREETRIRGGVNLCRFCGQLIGGGARSGLLKEDYNFVFTHFFHFCSFYAMFLDSFAHLFCIL